MDYRGHTLEARATTLPGSYYTSRDVFDREAERIFSRRWVCVGRADTIGQPGDYRLAAFGGESLILVRGRDGRARAFFNVCRHRGTRLCEEPAGRFAGGIQCPYHAWTYGLDGALLGAPHMADVAWFDKAEHPLVAAPLAEWEGFLYLNLVARRAAPAGSARAARRPLRLLEPAAAEDGAAASSTTSKANWKLIFQNFSECYHCPPVHPALSKLSHYRSGANDLRDGPLLGGYMAINEPGGSLTMTGRMCGAPIGDLRDDERQRVYYYSIFPNSFLTIQPDFVMATRLTPLAPDATRVVCDWLFAPETLETPGLRPGRRHRDLGRDEPPGLARLRARAAGRLVAGLRAGRSTRPRRASSRRSTGST